MKDTATKAIAMLNEINRLDPSAISALINYRVPCNQALTDHPTVQVGDITGGDAKTVGLLGILNGLFSDKEGNGCVGAILNHDGSVDEFVDFDSIPIGEVLEHVAGPTIDEVFRDIK